MRDHFIRRARGEKAQVVAAGGHMVGGEPVDLVAIDRPHVDLLVAEVQRGPRYPAPAGIEHPDLHAEDFCVPLRRARHISDVDDEMVEGIDLDRHELSFPARCVPRYWPPHHLFDTTRGFVNSTAANRT